MKRPLESFSNAISLMDFVYLEHGTQMLQNRIEALHHKGPQDQQSWIVESLPQL